MLRSRRILSGVYVEVILGVLAWSRLVVFPVNHGMRVVEIDGPFLVDSRLERRRQSILHLFSHNN